MSIVLEINNRIQKVRDPASHTEGFKTHHINSWWETPADFPALERIYTGREQSDNEHEMDCIMKNILAEMKKYPACDVKLKKWNARVSENVRNAGRFILDMTDSDLDILLNGGFFKVTGSFFQDARRYDSDIKLEDILQALRNVWIMNSIQVLMGEEIGITPSVFAYSMLYPYTDNLMDSRTATRSDKLKICRKLAKRLAGEDVKAENGYESSLYELITMIEEQYPREDYLSVYKSLLAIHSAQLKSLIQQADTCSPYEEDILGISFEKGGSSVMADAFLVKGGLSIEEAFYMYGFGVFLQLTDDLQDVCDDLRKGHLTIFSQTAGKWELDRLTNRLFNYIFKVVDSWTCFTAGKTTDMKDAIGKSCILLLLTAIAQNEKFYSKAYIKKLEAYSPLSFSYIRKLQKKVVKEYSSLQVKYACFGKEPLETVIACAAADPVSIR